MVRCGARDVNGLSTEFFRLSIDGVVAATGALMGSWRIRGDLPHRGCGRILAANVKNHQENYWPSRHARA